MQYLTATEARQFAEVWLPAWTGNDPEQLASFSIKPRTRQQNASPPSAARFTAVVGWFRRDYQKSGRYETVKKTLGYETAAGYDRQNCGRSKGPRQDAGSNASSRGGRNSENESG